jgi:hypothetical protein
MHILPMPLGAFQPPKPVLFSSELEAMPFVERRADPKILATCGAGDGDRTRNQRLGKPLLYH